MSINLIRSSAAGLVLAAAMSALAPAPAAAYEHATCDCVPQDNAPCHCDKGFKIGAEATKTYRGHCSYFDDMPTQTGDRNIEGPYTNAWYDADGNKYTQSMNIHNKNKGTNCAEQIPVNVYRQQQCTNWSFSKDSITVTVTCYKNN